MNMNQALPSEAGLMTDGRTVYHTDESDRLLPVFKTIKETAALGILPEAAIRTGIRTGAIPHIKSGTRVYINLTRWLAILNA